VVGALGVGHELSGERRADLGHGIREVVAADLHARGARGEQHDGVVGRHAAVGVDPVEGGRGRAAQHVIEVGPVDDGVGGDHHEHGGQRGREHAGALGHATDRPAVALRHRGLGDGVGGHDRLGGGGATVGGQPGRGGVDAGQQEVHREPLADQAGRADDDVTGGDVEDGTDVLGGAVGVLEAGGAGAGVGATAVEHHGIRPSVGDGGARPGDRRGLDPVAGEHRGGVVVGAVVDDERHVRSAGGLQAGGDARGPEAAWGGDGHQEVPPVSEVGVRTRPARRQAAAAAPASATGTSTQSVS
jgi:hypothetical protein